MLTERKEKKRKRVKKERKSKVKIFFFVLRKEKWERREERTLAVLQKGFVHCSGQF